MVSELLFEIANYDNEASQYLAPISRMIGVSMVVTQIALISAAYKGLKRKCDFQNRSFGKPGIFAQWR